MLDVLTVGYPSADLIMRVSRSPASGETATILDLPDMDSPLPGGCGANIAVGLTRLGLRAGLVSAIGNDGISKQYLKSLSTEDVDVSTVMTVPGKMPRCFLFVAPDGSHQTFYYPGVNAGRPLGIPDSVKSTATRWGVVTVGPKEHTLEMARSWDRKKVPILWSLRRDPIAFPKDLVRYLALVSKVAVMNEAEADMLVEALGLKQVEDVLSFGGNMEALMVTMGAAGSRVVWKEGEVHVPAVPPARFADPTGAGDAFCAGVLWGAIRGLSWDTSARVGAVVASFVLERLGAQEGLPNAVAVEKRYHEHFGEELVPA